MEDFLEDVYAQNQNTENFWGGGDINSLQLLYTL